MSYAKKIDINNVFDEVDDLVVIVDKEMKVKWLNQKATHFYAKCLNQFKNDSFIQVCKKMNLNYPTILDKASKSQSIYLKITEQKNQLHNNTIKWQIISPKNIQDDFFLIGRDITEIDKLMLQEQDKDILLKSIIDSLPGNYWWKNLDGRYMGCNGNVSKLLGLPTPDFVVNKTDYELPWLSIADELVENDKYVMETGESISREENVLTRFGNTLNFLVTKSPLYNAKGKMIGTIGTSIDITERKEQERLLAQARADAEIAKQNEEELRKAAMIFAGSIAHDLTTPLVNIRMMADNADKFIKELIQHYKQTNNDGGLKEFQINYIENLSENIKTQVEELNSFITDSLKALNKTVSGIHLHEDLVKCHLWKCVQKVIDEYPFAENQQKLIHWDRSYLFDFMGNPLMFYRILFNLIKNALYQINKHQQGEIFIRAEQKEQYNVVYFKDTAGNVTEQIVNNIFGGYKTTKQEGTGVGLAFCKLTMQSFGGDMTCHLVDGEYIEFELIFPII